MLKIKFLLTENKSGFTLMEVLVSVFVIMILTIGIYGMVIFSLKITSDNKNYVEAIAIADQRIEQIRNLPYSSVGVQGGIPSGVIPQEDTAGANNNFTVNVYITYFDDSYDGEAGSTTPDSIPTDYKIVTVKVSWLSRLGMKSVTEFTKVIPRTVEIDEGYGMIKIYVGNANAQPVSNAEVRVVNNVLNPPIDVVNVTNSGGVLYLPAPTSTLAYQITVTKTDQEYLGIFYGKDQTYDPGTSKSPFHLSVIKGEVSAESFVIDKLGTLHIETVSTNLPDNTIVNQASSDNKINPVLGADASGNIYYAWQNLDPPNSYIYLQKYNSAKVKQWGSDKSISTTLYQTNPDIAVSNTGDSYIVWQDNSRSLKAITYNSLNNSKKTLFAFDRKNKYDYIIVSDKIRQDLTYANSTNILWKGHENDLMRNYFSSLEKFIARAKSLFDNQQIVNTANAAGTIVQTKIGSVVNTGSSLSATFDSTPTAGNVIIAIAMNRHSSTSFSAPYNTAGTFTVSAYSNISYELDVGIWHKVVGASEPLTVTINNSGSISGGVLMLMEVTGLDTSSLVDITKTNDQTSGSSNTATTNSTAVSASTGFAVAAIGWADNDFNTPTSANWTSGSPDTWTHRLWEDWSSGNDGSLAVATLNVTSAAAQKATLTTTPSGTGEERNNVIVVYRTVIPNNITVSSNGSQITSSLIPNNDVYTGGSFVLSDNTGSHTINSITISENGTVDAQNNLNNIKLFYDLDTSAPYDCASEIYNGTEPQYGSTDTDGFSGSSGTSVFTGSASISLTQSLCLYPVMDIKGDATKNQTINIFVNNPSTDISINSGNVLPSTAVDITGETTLLAPADMRQIHYRWRNDDGSETNATWKEYEDTGTTVNEGALIRLRFSIANSGSLSTDPIQYRLEYGETASDCSGVASWTALPYDDSLDWRIIDSANLNNNDPTTDNSGLTNEYSTFSPGEVKDLSNQTSAITLGEDEFTEIEYALKSSTSAGNNLYCFRLTNVGDTNNFNYFVFPEISVIGDDNIYLYSLDSSGNERWPIKRVNFDIANEIQKNPRIAITENFGPATTTIVWEDYRNGNSDIYAQFLDASGNKILSNDLRITSSSTDEYDASIVLDSNDNFYVVWVEDNPEAQKIYLQKCSLNGLSCWPYNRNIVLSSYDVNSPEIKVSGGSIYLSYTETVFGIQTSYLSKYDSDGNSLWEKQANLESSADNKYSPSLIVNGSYAYVSWTDLRNSNEDIYVQKFDLNGNVFWTQDWRLNIETGTSTQKNSKLVFNSLGTAFAVWEDYRNKSNYDIYSTDFTDPGAITNVPNVSIHLQGTQTISETPKIYEYDIESITGASGYKDLTVEFDSMGYNVELGSTSPLTTVLIDPVPPVPLLPDETKTILLYVQ